ncbi:uncharacterized protein EAE98_006621 [Botrytis deweyae]|uniref:PHD-type domain-containing protein n=1 Tax=Botrytis deweyae TaxID=2478750 RepID=A0ABQ7IJV1_9HELO|nr:uncharacterized protein EAE98_006621 [Botrytis deweyae]KAF7926326.1 hypothetical protein EAE98_006621 [Botrytis deweyae]
MTSNSTSWMNGSSWSPSRTSTKNPFDDSNGDPFDDRYATPLQDIETGTTARLSSETQQQDAVDQSGVPSEEKRIIEDIQNERMSCEICLEPVRFAKDRYLWNCKSCHAVTHHRCTKLWAKAEPIGRTLAWKCPKCENIEHSTPKGKCWCGKGNPLHDHPTIPNACLKGVCGSKSKCAHGNKSSCRKPCHPGPCKIIGGPDIQWYNQMKDSCRGFDTRVKIGTRFSASTYTLHSLNASIDNQTFYLAPVLAPKFGSKEPYQYFHRFSGSTANTANYAIDVDIDNGVWRELHFNGTDELTKWWASGRKQYPSVHPIFDNITITEDAIKRNGTFVTRDGHLWMPKFDLIFQGLEDSRKHAEIEPFIRVFDTQGLPHSRTEKLLSAKWNWNNRHDPSIVMRTASFGHGRQRLDMCIKEDFYYSSSGAQQKRDGVSDGSIMPLAVVAAFRMRMNEMYALNSGRPFNVKKYSEYDDVKAIA